MKRITLLSLIVPLAVSAATAVDIVDGFGKMGYLDCPASGEMHFPTILVSYTDVDFVEGADAAIAHFNEKFNAEGYTANGGPGSARDYFTTASGGRFTPVFDILGSMVLKHERKFYGGDYGGRRDAGTADMVVEAVEAFGASIDWSKYDSDGDFKVDDVVIVFAGESTYSGNIADAILPTSFVLHYDRPVEVELSARGWDIPGTDYYIDNYTLINEINGGKYDGLGTFVHEYMHGLGLADLYNTWDENASYTPQAYDVMDTGIYNHSSLYPPTPSAFERFALGWLDVDFLDESGRYELAPLEDGNPAAYGLYVNDHEIYVVENRQKKGWDSYIPGHGMLLWHIDFDEKAWYDNKVNYHEDHQRVDLIEATGKWYKNSMMHNRYPFPGAANVTRTPWFEAKLDGREAKVRLTDISESEDGMISFTLNADFPDALHATESGTAATAKEDGVFVGPDGRVFIKAGGRRFDLMGRPLSL